MKNASIVLTLCLALLSSSVRSQTQPQYFAGTGHWYQVIYLPPTPSWDQANDSATAHGGYLACITSQEENDFVFTLIPSPYTGTFLGGLEISGEGDWHWLSGDPWGYTNWNAGEPNNGYNIPPYEDRTEMGSSTGINPPPRKWNDCPHAATSNSNCAVVEYNSDPGSFCAGNALQFDGIDDEVVIPDSPTLNFAPGAPMTVECWFYPTPGVSSHAILGRRSGTYMNYQISYGGGVFDFFSPNGNRIRANYAPPLNQWTHVAGTDDGTNSHLYINGVEQGSSSYYGSVNDGSPLRIGGSASDPRFVGQIDEVRLWNVARSAAEIAANYNRTVDCNTFRLVGYWKFDEANSSDQNAIDCSVMHNNGTLGSDLTASSSDPIRVVSTAPVSGPCNCPSLVVSPFYQRGPDAPWSDHIYDHPNTWNNPPHVEPPCSVAGSICSDGCFITCLAMLTRYYGITTGADGYPVDPDHLNNWLIENHAYDENGNLTHPDLIFPYSGNKIVFLRATDTRKKQSSQQENLVFDDLQAGRPVILRVKFNTVWHYVLATGKSDCTHYDIVDPLVRTDNTTRTSLSEPPYNDTYFGTRHFAYMGDLSKSLTVIHSSLTLSSYDRLSLSAADSAGNRCGYDPTTDSIYEETPQISYFEEFHQSIGTADDGTIQNDTVASSNFPRKTLYWAALTRNKVRVQIYPWHSGQINLRCDYMNSEDSTLSSEFAVTVDSGVALPLWISCSDTSSPALISLCGNANGDATVNISDVVYLIAYIFSGGSAPSPLLAGDANCNGSINISDAVYLIAYIFSGGPVPCAGCK